MEDLKVYKCKDGRWRACYRGDNGKWKYVSYPRLLMEEHIGRKLLPNEDVHHKDGNFDNNDISNLEIALHGEHQRSHALKYTDKSAVCAICGNSFVWTGKRQRGYYSDLRAGRNRIITCSKSCSSLYGRMKQLGKL